MKTSTKTLLGSILSMVSIVFIGWLESEKALKMNKKFEFKAYF